MFKHLPKISDDDFGVLVEKESSILFNKFECWNQGVTDLWEVTQFACQEFADDNPNMVKAVYACGLTVQESLVALGATPRAGNLCGFLCLTNVLTLLRLIDRSIEAEELEHKFIK